VSVALILLPKIVNLSHGSPRPMMSDPTCTRSGMLSRGYIPTGNAAHVHSHMHTHTHTLANALQKCVKPAHLNTMYEMHTHTYTHAHTHYQIHCKSVLSLLT
jgi:hypothetical protein